MVTLNRRNFCAAGVSSLLLSVFSAKVQAQGAGASVLRLAGTKTTTRLDPHIDVRWEVLMVLSAVYDTLVFQNSDGAFVPGLASSWEMSDDGMAYEFELRDDVTFHDGTPFNAEAVAYNFERIKGLGNRSFKASSLIADVTEVEILDDYRLRLILSQPNSSLMFNLSLTYMAMISPTAGRAHGDDYHMHQAGTGPYRFSEYTVGGDYRLVRNPDYAWAPDIYDNDGVAFMEELVWGYITEPSTRAVALLAGDYDVVFDLQPTTVARVNGSGAHEAMVSLLSGQPAYWFLNTQFAPLDDIHVRRAILAGVDMEAAVTSVMRGLAPKAYGPITAVTPEYTADVVGMHPYDISAAAALLDEAGWTLNAGGTREKDGQPLVLKVQMTNWGNSEPFSVFLQSELRKLGITVELEMMTYGNSMVAGREGTHHMLFTGGSGFAVNDSLFPFFLSDNVESGFAFSKYADPDLDALLIGAETTTNADERLALYQQAQQRIMENALILPIYDYSQVIGVSKRVQGLNFGVTGLVPSIHDVTV